MIVVVPVSRRGGRRGRTSPSLGPPLFGRVPQWSEGDPLRRIVFLGVGQVVMTILRAQ